MVIYEKHLFLMWITLGGSYLWCYFCARRWSRRSTI